MITVMINEKPAVYKEVKMSFSCNSKVIKSEQMNEIIISTFTLVLYILMLRYFSSGKIWNRVFFHRGICTSSSTGAVSRVLSMNVNEHNIKQHLLRERRADRLTALPAEQLPANVLNSSSRFFSSFGLSLSFFPCASLSSLLRS